MNHYLKVALEEIYEDITGDKPSVDIGNMSESDLAQLAIDHHEAHQAAEKASQEFLSTANGTDALVQLSEILTTDTELSVESMALVKETVKRAVKESRINVSNEDAILAFFIIMFIASFVAYIVAVINVQRKRKAQAEALNKAFEESMKSYNQSWDKVWEDLGKKRYNTQNQSHDDGKPRADGSNISILIKNIPKWKERSISSLSISHNPESTTGDIIKALQEGYDGIQDSELLDSLLKISSETLKFVKEANGKKDSLLETIMTTAFKADLAETSFVASRKTKDLKPDILKSLDHASESDITSAVYNRRVSFHKNAAEDVGKSIKPINSVLLKISNFENGVSTQANKIKQAAETTKKDFEEIKKLSENISHEAMADIKTIEAKVKDILHILHSNIDKYTKATTLSLQIFNIYRSYLQEIHSAIK